MNDVRVLFEDLKQLYTIKNDPNETPERRHLASDRIGYFYGNYVNEGDLLTYIFDDILCPEKRSKNDNDV